MLADFVQKLWDLGERAHQVQQIDLPANRRRLIMADGSVEDVTRDPERVQTSLLSFKSLLDWCDRFGRGQSSLIEVGERSVHVLSDYRNRHLNDTAELMLVKSAGVLALENWENVGLSQRQVMRLLRTELAGSFDERYLSIFRRLDFQRRNDGTKELKHTGESLGRSIEKQAQSLEGEIPETLVFTLPIYSNVPGEHQTLRFAVDVDADAESIEISPINDCFTSAYRTAREQLIERLESEFATILIIEADVAVL